MKYLKLFENVMLDKILDKISKTGMGSLTSLETEFLDKFSSGEHREVETKMKERERKYKGMLEYDPRKDDPDAYKGIGKAFGVEDMNFNDWTDQEIEDEKYLHLWDQLYDEDMYSFLQQYQLPVETGELAWDKLSKPIQKSFRKYIKDIGMLD